MIHLGSEEGERAPERTPEKRITSDRRIRKH